MIVFSGADNYASYQAAFKYAQDLAATSGDSLKVIDIDDLQDPADLMSRLSSMSLFGGGEVLLVKRLLANSKFAKYITDHQVELQDANLVIWHDEAVDKRLGLVKQLTKSQRLREFGEPTDGEMLTWLRAEARSLKLELSSDLASLIIQRLGHDKWLILNELRKLALYVDATGAKLEGSAARETIEHIIGIQITGDIWKFLDSLTSGDKTNMWREFEKLMAYSDMTQYIMTMVNRELTLLAQVKAAPNPQALSLSPFVIKKTQAKISRFSWQKLQQLAKALMRLDVAIKSGKVEPEIGITLYLLSW